MRKVAGYVKAVDGVSLTINQGRTLALVGESGCGKTTVGKSILQLIPPTAGSVRYKGRELVGLERKRLREMRAEFQLIFQDPYSSLNPRMRIVEIIEEGIKSLNPVDVEREARRPANRGTPKQEDWTHYWRAWGCRRKQSGVIHMNFPAASASVLRLPVLWQSIPS